MGLKVGIILALSNNLHLIFKLWFADPRPYWVSAQVKAFAAEGTFATPSGHAQNAVALWGIMAYGVRRRWAWIAAFALAFLIGLSRLYLGVHFVHNILAGWLIGGLLLWGVLQLWDPASAWLRERMLGQQMLIAFVVSMMFLAAGILSASRLDGYSLPQEWRVNALRAETLPDPVSIEDMLTSAGSLFGLAAGAAWMASRGGYRAEGPVAKRAHLGCFFVSNWRRVPVGSMVLCYNPQIFRVKSLGAPLIQ